MHCIQSYLNLNIFRRQSPVLKASGSLVTDDIPTSVTVVDTLSWKLFLPCYFSPSSMSNENVEVINKLRKTPTWLGPHISISFHHSLGLAIPELFISFLVPLQIVIFDCSSLAWLIFLGNCPWTCKFEQILNFDFPSLSYLLLTILSCIGPLCSCPDRN